MLGARLATLVKLGSAARYLAVRDRLVSGYETPYLIEGFKLPDPADRHVLAAAIKAGAQVIIIGNPKHSPAADLR